MKTEFKSLNTDLQVHILEWVIYPVPYITNEFKYELIEKVKKVMISIVPNFRYHFDCDIYAYDINNISNSQIWNFSLISNIDKPGIFSFIFYLINHQDVNSGNI